MHQAFRIFLQLFTISAIRYLVLAGIPFLVCYVLLSRWLSPARIQHRTAGKADFWREIGWSLLSTAVFAFIAYLILHTPLKKITRVYTNISDYPMWWIFVSLILSLIVHDTYFYWMHRLLHHRKLFQYTHLVHHQSTNPSPWTAYSFHFFEAWTEGGVLLVITMIMPLHPLTILLFTVVGFMINVYGHLGYEIAPKWLRKTFLFGIVNTSVHHNMHHSKFRGNYGLYFRFWDRLLGTEHPDYVKEYDRVQANRESGYSASAQPLASNVHSLSSDVLPASSSVRPLSPNAKPAASPVQPLSPNVHPASPRSAIPAE